MSNWIILPVVMPALLAPILAFVTRHDLWLSRVLSLAGAGALVGVALHLLGMAATDEVHVYDLGDWPAPFGIVLVLDRLSAMLVLLTAVLALLVLIHAVASGWDNRGRHFHALYQFQLMGICGAFLTGDAFNLFVFFEVLLIASYGLMIHSGGRLRLKAGLQYMVMNLAGSTLFLIALGTIYAVTGTLNIADLAVRVREIPLEDAALLRVAAVLLLVVFSIKAALFPVQFWLPGTYANAPAPVAALFAIMTKVGAYAILRFYTIVFPPDVVATGALPSQAIFAGAVLTIAVGAFGVLGAKRLMPMLAFAVLGSMGTLLIAVSQFTPASTFAALYYLIHSTFAAAALFLIADLVVERRGEIGDRLSAALPVVQNGLFAALFMAGAIGVAGMPPLSGFLGKLLVLDALSGSGHMALAWSAVLLGSLFTIVGFARAGSTLFWKATAVAASAGPAPETGDDDEAGDERPTPLADADAPAVTPWGVMPTIGAIAALALLATFANPLSHYLQATSDQLIDWQGYVTAVIGTGLEG